MNLESKPAVTPVVPEKKWYVVSTTTTLENKAKSSIEERARSLKLEDFFGQILVPSESYVELVKGQKKERERKVFPGYIFVQMILNDKTWHAVTKSNGVKGFVGGKKPNPIAEEEVVRVTQQAAAGLEKPKARARYSVGDTVVVRDGPFSNFTGVVEDINDDKSKVKVSVSIFGRPTLVEFDFIQVEKS